MLPGPWRHDGFDTVPRAPAAGKAGVQLRRELRRVQVPPAPLVRMIGEAAGHAALGAYHARPDVGRADLDAPILDLEDNRLHPPGVIEAKQTGVMRLECVDFGTLPNRRPSMNRPRRATEIPEEPSKRMSVMSLRCSFLASILAAIHARRAALPKHPPLLVKIAPDLAEDALGPIVEACVAQGIAGLIISNTTITRPPSLQSALKDQAGGLSGAPLFTLSTEMLRRCYHIAQGRLALIGVGGIASAEQAYAKIRAGAALVQLYSGFAYAGPVLVRQILDGLAALLARDGFTSVADAVGKDA